MTDEEKKQLEEENREALLLALAFYVNDFTKEEVAKYGALGDMPEEAVQAAEAKLESSGLKDFAEQQASKGEPVWYSDAQQKVAELGEAEGVEEWEVLNPMNGRTCRLCEPWVGKRLSNNPASGLPSVKDWQAAGASHPNCQCSLHPVKEVEAARQAKARIKTYNTKHVGRVVMF